MIYGREWVWKRVHMRYTRGEMDSTFGVFFKIYIFAFESCTNERVEKNRTILIRTILCYAVSDAMCSVVRVSYIGIQDASKVARVGVSG